MFVLLIEQVAHLEAEAPMRLTHEVRVGELHVDVVIGLEYIFRVGIAPHAFAHIEVGGRELQIVPANDSGDS